MRSQTGARYLALGACARRGVRPPPDPPRCTCSGGSRSGGSPKPGLTCSSSSDSRPRTLSGGSRGQAAGHQRSEHPRDTESASESRRSDRPSTRPRTICATSGSYHAPLAALMLQVRRHSRKESGADRDHLSTNRERLITGRRTSRGRPGRGGQEPPPVVAWVASATTACGLAGEEGFEPSIS
jgi:hypothetical protein